MAGTVLRCLGTLALAALSMAQTWSSPNWRPVSGLTGDFSEFYTASEVHALNRLEFYEHADDPMLIKIWLEKLCHDPPCDPGPRDIELRAGTAEENFGTREILSAGDDHYIVSIQVCTTDDNDLRRREIKGARIWTARLQPGGIVDRTGGDPWEFDRPNCNNHWRERRSCLGNRVVVLGNRVVVGLRAYFNDDSPQFNNRRWF